jgi:ABC-type transport system involved in multi-copper enzyme maturation permease subunit
MPTFLSFSLLAQSAQRRGFSLGPNWGVAIGIGIALVLALLVFSYTTRAGIIARSTTKEAIRQPIFGLMMGITFLILLINTYLPFFTLGEDIKMFKDCGLATILVCGMLLAIWTASVSIAEEIEGKTAMTLLSKPINRRQFVVGKYIGIVQAILLLYLPLVICFLAFIYYKVPYDAREASSPAPEAIVRLAVVVHVVPAIVLILMETLVMAAVSVAISTRLPMIVNMVTCFTIFVIGHLTPSLVHANSADNTTLEMVQFTAQLIATVLPSLEIFNAQAAIATDAMVPAKYLGFSLLYSVAYCAAAILLAFILFEDRDLA